jgi:hypothetical protein
MVTDPVSRIREAGSVSVLIDEQAWRSNPSLLRVRPVQPRMETDDGVEPTSLPVGNRSRAGFGSGIGSNRSSPLIVPPPGPLVVRGLPGRVVHEP